MNISMKRFVSLGAMGALALSLATSAVAGPAAKFAAQVKDLQIVPKTAGTGGYVTVLTTALKTPNQKDLLIGVSFETGLYTQTLVRSKNGSTDTESATATLKVRVLLDGQQVSPDVEPDEVVYDHRLQQLSAILGGVIDSCTVGEDGIIDVATECTVTDEEINLVLDTMAAHHFNFIVRDLGPGDHTAEVQVWGTTSASSADASAWVAVGRGALSVEEVRAINLSGGIVFEN
jgi:hypothetical protein